MSIESFLQSLTLPTIPLGSPGKSGSRLCYTGDREFVLKAVGGSECADFISLLPAYFRYVSAHPDSLLMRLYGMYRIADQAVIVTENVLRGSSSLQRVFDLKGSTIDRAAGAAAKLEKDCDLERTFSVGADWRRRLAAVLVRDVEARLSCG